jgi:hypothetical protein
MVPYQLSGVEESIALVYGEYILLVFWEKIFFFNLDQALALQGYISLKAFRLTPAALENLKNEDYFSPDRYEYYHRDLIFLFFRCF